MAQYARPDSTTWSQNMNVVGDTPINNCIDDVSPDDTTTMCQHPNSTSIGGWRVTLSSVTAPPAGTRTLRIRWQYDPSASTKTATIRLFEGGSGFDSGSLVQSWASQAPTGTSFENLDLTVTEAISDYSDVQLQVVDNGEDSIRIRVTQAYLEVPDVASGPTAGGDPTLDGPPTEASIFLTWVDSVDNTGCYVHRSTSQGFTPIVGTRLSSDLGASTNSYEDSTVDPFTQYYYVVEWTDGAGSTYSNELAGKSCYARPSDIIFSNVTATSITTSLTRGAVAAHHAIFCYDDGDDLIRAAYLNPGVTSAVFGSLTGGLYTFRSQAYDTSLNSGTGAFSTLYSESQYTDLRAVVTAFDLEAGNVSWAVVTAFELEVPQELRWAVVTAFELEAPDFERQAVVTAFELETGGGGRQALVTAFELEVPVNHRQAIVTAFELETPNTTRHAVVTAFELQAPGELRQAIVTAFELESPNEGRTLSQPGYPAIAPFPMPPVGYEAQNETEFRRRVEETFVDIARIIQHIYEELS